MDTEPYQGIATFSIGVGLLRKLAEATASYMKYGKLLIYMCNLLMMVDMKEDKVMLQIFMLWNSEWSKMSEAWKFRQLL